MRTRAQPRRRRRRVRLRRRRARSAPRSPSATSSCAALYAQRHAGARSRRSDFPQFAGALRAHYRSLRRRRGGARRRGRVPGAAARRERARRPRELYERGLRVLDLSADFRLRSPATYDAVVRRASRRPSCCRTRATASSSATARRCAARAWSRCPAATRRRRSWRWRRCSTRA